MPKKPVTIKTTTSKPTKKSKKEEDEISEPDVEEMEKMEDDVEYQEEDDNVDEEDDELDEEIPFEDDGKTCAIQKGLEEDTEYYDDEEEIEVQPDTSVEYVNKEDRQSSAKLTKYEMVRILGERCKQLTMGAKPLIKNYKGLSYDKVAEEELKLNMVPYKIRRPLPNGKYELWNLEELAKDHLLSLLE